MALVASCPRRLWAPRLDESFVQGAGAEFACTIALMLFAGDVGSLLSTSSMQPQKQADNMTADICLYLPFFFRSSTAQQVPVGNVSTLGGPNYSFIEYEPDDWLRITYLKLAQFGCKTLPQSIN